MFKPTPVHFRVTSEGAMHDVSYDLTQSFAWGILNFHLTEAMEREHGAIGFVWTMPNGDNLFRYHNEV